MGGKQLSELTGIGIAVPGYFMNVFVVNHGLSFDDSHPRTWFEKYSGVIPKYNAKIDFHNTNFSSHI